ncbi:outer membrane beta-barrel protein [Xanthobacter sp. V0B-10]|uniref:outer membrane protein n=1 Tax=Xanthobacter albus TaxID=3119929 RepID=UPI003728415E
MKSVILAAVAIAAVSAPAVAADLGSPYPVKSAPAPAFSWTGFYIGGNAGVGAGRVQNDELRSVGPNNQTYYNYRTNTFRNYNPGTLLGSSSNSVTSSGAVVGGQVGYNYQLRNNIVLGFETDLQWSGVKGKTRSDTSSNLVSQYQYYYDPVTNTNNVASIYGGQGERSAGVDYFGTIRARVGYAMDRFLPYFTGGAAYGRTSVEGSDTTLTNVASWDSTGARLPDRVRTTTVGLPSQSEEKWGWTIGGGGEFAVTNNWIVKAEYLYVDLGSSEYTYLNTEDNTYHNGTADFKFHTVRAGVNYKF